MDCALRDSSKLVQMCEIEDCSREGGELGNAAAAINRSLIVYCWGGQSVGGTVHTVESALTGSPLILELTDLQVCPVLQAHGEKTAGDGESEDTLCEGEIKCL